MTDWPFTPEVETGGWQMVEHHRTYRLDPEFHGDDDGWYPESEASANVNLIAAAPRMYRALKTLLAGLIDEPSSDEDPGCWLHVTSDQLQSAIDVIDWIDQR